MGGREDSIFNIGVPSIHDFRHSRGGAGTHPQQILVHTCLVFTALRRRTVKPGWSYLTHTKCYLMSFKDSAFSTVKHTC